VASDHLDPAEHFEEYAQNAVDSLPSDLRGNMSNVTTSSSAASLSASADRK
jgi:predicted Zn-dependent protease with MMP-like domain